MKKIILSVLVVLLVLSGCSAGNSSNNEVVEQEQKEPIGYSEPIYIVAKENSGISDATMLSGKVLAVQKAYDAESSDYVVEELTKQGIEVELKELDFYQDLPQLINNDEIDAWVISKGPHELLFDYRHDYEEDDYEVVAEYKIPYYEEQKVDSDVLNHNLLNKPFAVMLTGIDERIDPSEYTKGRNDTNLLMIVNPSLKHVLTISFPRDSYIKNVCTGGTDKLAHFGINGTECIKDSIGNLLDIDVEYFAQVSFSTFIEMIDSLGGIEVDVPIDFCMDQDSYRDVSQPYCLTKGEDQLLYGEWALALARNRKYSNLYNGDYGRIRNQALIVDGIVERIAENPFLLLWAGLDWKFDSLVYHNFDAKAKDIAALFHLAGIFGDDYMIDNYFIENVGDQTESGMSIGRVPDYTIEIAKLKAQYALTGSMDKDNPYYDDALVGYVTKGAGNYVDKYMGEKYNLLTGEEFSDVEDIEEVDD